MSATETKTPARSEQFLLICLGYCHGPECTRDAMARIAALRPAEKKRGLRLGVSAVFPTFNYPVRPYAQRLTRFLGLAEEFDLPVVVQFEGEHWRDARPDLWNWWDPHCRLQPGESAERGMGRLGTRTRDSRLVGQLGPAGADQAGENPMSPRYRDAVHTEMRASIPQSPRLVAAIARRQERFVRGHQAGARKFHRDHGYYYPTATTTRTGPKRRTSPGPSHRSASRPGDGAARLRGRVDPRTGEVGRIEGGASGRGGPGPPARPLPPGS